MVWSALAAGALGAWGANRANKTQIDLANTGYQRAMADMRKGGLNPILAGKYGPAATPTMQNVGSAAVQGYTGVTSAHSAKNLQGSQAKLADMNTEATSLSNDIKRLKDIPVAKVNHFIDRISARFVDFAENVVKSAGNIEVIPESLTKDMTKILVDARTVSFELFKKMIKGASATGGAVNDLVDKLSSGISDAENAQIDRALKAR